MDGSVTITITNNNSYETFNYRLLSCGLFILSIEQNGGECQLQIIIGSIALLDNNA